jgi:adenylate kinase family enzyme
VHGPSGSGKTTFARRLAARIDVPWTELDAIHHQPNWTPLATEEFRGRVEAVVSAPAWVVEGNYRAVRDLTWSRADLVVILDRPRWVVMTRLVRRTARRLLHREVLWNGNCESLRNLFSRDAERNILLWSWRTHQRYHDEVPREAREALGESRVRVLHRDAEVAAFLARPDVDPTR